MCRREVKHHALDVLDLQEEVLLLQSTLDLSLEHRRSLLTSLRQADWNMDRICIEGHAFRASW
jgi:hypothetical protein